MINKQIRDSYNKLTVDPANAERLWGRIVESVNRSQTPETESAPEDIRSAAAWGQAEPQPADEAWAGVADEDDGYSAPAPAASRRARHQSAPAKKKLRLTKPVIIAVAAAVLVLIAVLLIIRLAGKNAKPQETQGMQTSGSLIGEDLNKALDFEGPDWALQKIDNTESALKEWDEYKAQKLQTYLATRVPNMVDFLNKDGEFDGTEIQVNGDDTYTLIHWRYEENWSNSSVSPITGEQIPELVQVMDYENTCTVDETEYGNYLNYQELKRAEGAYLDYSYIYSVGDAEEASKLEEIASKHGLTVRRGEEVSYGYGQSSDSELLSQLSAAVGKGDVYTPAPQFDHFFYFDNGSFQSIANVTLSDSRRMYTCISNTAYNEMVDGREAGAFTVEDPASLKTRSYTSKDGTELTISQNDTQAIVYAYLDNSYVVVDMSIAAWRQSPTGGETEEQLAAMRESDLSLSEDAVNYAADCINFSNIGK